MYTKPTQLTAIADARPLRVAFLLNPGDCPSALLDEIFREAYGRWGGRRSLIVPTTPEGIDARFEKWLALYDPDVIYSFVELSEDMEADIHERYAPAYYKQHRSYHDKTDEHYYRVDLPITALSSLPA
jgi:hypothetical protein